MSPAFPFITANYAAALGLLGAALTVNVIVNRVRTGIDSGDGGVAALAGAIRAHGNFTEQVPLALALIALDEALGVPAYGVHALAIALVLARVLSAWGLLTTLKQSFGRQAGAGLTVLTTAIASLLIFYVALAAR